MAARDQAAVGVERNAAAELRRTGLDQLLALALAAEAEQLVVLDLLVGEGVVDEREIDVFRSDARLFVCLLRGVARHCRRADDRAEEGVARRVGLGLQRRRQHPHQWAARLQFRCDLRCGENRAGGAVVDRAGHHRGERLGYHRRGEYLFDGDLVVGLAIGERIERAVVPVLGGDGREVFRPGTAFVHAPHRPQSEVGRRQDHAVDTVAADAAAPAAGAHHVGHLVEAESHRDLTAAARHRVRRFAEGDEAGGGGILDMRDGQAGEAELLHDADAAHRRAFDVADPRFTDVRQYDAGVAHRGETGFARQLEQRAIAVIAEAHHADADHGDVVELHDPDLSPAAASGRKRKIATSSPRLLTRSVSRSSSISMPMRKSPGPPESTACTRGPSGRSICPTP